MTACLIEAGYVEGRYCREEDSCNQLRSVLMVAVVVACIGLFSHLYSVFFWLMCGDEQSEQREGI